MYQANFYKEMSRLAEKLIGRDIIAMSDVEIGLVNCPNDLENAEIEIIRLRKIVIQLAKNELSESEKTLLLTE